MSKSRMINTKFWSDAWIRKLNALDRYLFMYLLTNEHTNICGVYELPIGTMAYETGIDERDLEKTMIPRLAPKMYYVDEWVYLRNFEKHQMYNESIKIGMAKAKKDIPERILAKIKVILEKEAECIQGGTGCGVSESESESKLELKLELEPNRERGVATQPHTPVKDTPFFIARDFFSKGKYYQEYLSMFSEQGNYEVVLREFEKFILYWTEPNGSGTKERWQKETTFDVKRRLVTWLGNIKNFSNNRKETKII